MYNLFIYYPYFIFQDTAEETECSGDGEGNLSSCSSMMSTSSSATPQTRKKRRQNIEASDDEAEKEMMSKAMAVINKKADSAQVFGDFVADRLRTLPTQIAEITKNKIMKDLLDATSIETSEIIIVTDSIAEP